MSPSAHAHAIHRPVEQESGEVSWHRRNFWMTLAVAILSLFVSGFVAYSHSQDSDHSRITAVEVQQKNDGQSLSRIETKVDKQGEQIGKMYEYIVGMKAR